MNEGTANASNEEIPTTEYAFEWCFFQLIFTFYTMTGNQIYFL